LKKEVRRKGNSKQH